MIKVIFDTDYSWNIKICEEKNALIGLHLVDTQAWSCRRPSHRPASNAREHRPTSNAREHRPTSNAREHRPASNAREHRPTSNK